MVDAGFSGKQLASRLIVLGVQPDDVDAIVITHDHGDHTRGAGIFSRRYDTPLYITDRTLDACSDLFRGTEPTRPYRPGYPFHIGRLRIEPFITVHDAADPVAVAVVDTDTDTRVGIATDLGRPTAQVRLALSGSDFLILEANHDEAMLQTGPYPWSVKRRIASSHGHLSNHSAAQLANELLHPRLAGILLAHLSNESNTPELARSVVSESLKESGYVGYLEVALQDSPTEFLDIEVLRAASGPEQMTLL
jgi:phosphoribosyl 1,2-cyclic phosphodiesterase